MYNIYSINKQDNNINFKCNPFKHNVKLNKKITDRFVNEFLCEHPYANFMPRNFLAQYVLKHVSPDEIKRAQIAQNAEDVIESHGIIVKRVSIYQPFNPKESEFEIYYNNKDRSGIFYGNLEQYKADKKNGLTMEESLMKQFAEAVKEEKLPPPEK